MMTDRFDAQLRQHLLGTANEQPADGQLEAVATRVANAPQRPPLAARLTWLSDRTGAFPTAALRYGLVAAVLLGLIAAAAILGGGTKPAGGTIFEGTWTSTDPGDGSTQTLVVGRGTQPDVLFHDDVFTGGACAADEVKVFTAEGTGTVVGDQLDVVWPDGGGCGLTIVSMGDGTYTYDEAAHVLVDGQSLRWARVQLALPPPTRAPVPPPTSSPSLDPDQIVAEGTLVTFAASGPGQVLTVWETCEGQFETDCGHAWRLGAGSQTLATGLIGRGDVHVDVYATEEGFLLTPPRDRSAGTFISHDGTATEQLMDCDGRAWSVPTQPGRFAWAAGLSYIDTVSRAICPAERLGGRPLAQGAFAADGTLWGLVDNETGPDTLTIGRFDGVEWQYRDFAAHSGSWTSRMAAAGATVAVLQANPEPSPRPDQLVGFAVTTDGGATWTEAFGSDVLERDLPFSTYTHSDPDASYSGYTSMAFAGPSVLYVADGRGNLWRSADLSTFSQVPVTGYVSDLKPTGDAVLGRIAEANLIRVSPDGSIESITIR